MQETKAGKLARLEDEKLAKQKRWNDIAVERKLCKYVDGKVTLDYSYPSDMAEAGRIIKEIVDKEFAMAKKRKDEDEMMAAK